MKDFTIAVFRDLLSALQDRGYCFQTFDAFLSAPESKVIILRHDVDRAPLNSLTFARIEHEFGLKGSYYFRIGPQSFKRNIILEIAALGHETGYHYEDVPVTARKIKMRKAGPGSPEERELLSKAHESLSHNLALFREIHPVSTVCMHGSPLSRWNSRAIWKYHDFRALGIKGEPYFSLDLSDMLYLTDTGRRWNGSSVSVRDKGIAADSSVNDWKVKPFFGSALNLSPEALQFQSRYNFRSTMEIIEAAGKGELPDRIMITLHPQRWNDSILPWLKEYIGQNIRNIIKYFIVRRRHKTLTNKQG